MDRNDLVSREAAQIQRVYGLDEDLAWLVADAADDVGGRGIHLANVIYAESRFDPTAVNPRSGAVGLIQFLPETARGLGLTLDQIREMGFARQIDVVSYYLQLVASGAWAGGGSGLLDDQYKMALAVFYPAWRNRPSSSRLPKNVQERNPGIETVGDYVSFVLRKARPA